MKNSGISTRQHLHKPHVAQILHRVSIAAGTIAMMGGFWAAAQSAVTVPDAQIEANVLKALAGAPDLANESITTRTVYGVVTLSGNVHDDAGRTKADNLAAAAVGVVRVVDQLQVDAGPSSANSAEHVQGVAGTVLQSDGTYAPAALDAAEPAAPGSEQGILPAQRDDPEHDQLLDLHTEQQQQGSSPTSNPNPSPNPNPNPSLELPGGGATQPQSISPQGNPYPQPGTGYPQNKYPRNSYPPAAPYGNNPNFGENGPYGGQRAGQAVVVPTGTMMRIRINRFLASDRVQPGQPFDGVVSNDVVANGLVAIPRGATVQGIVVDAKASGTLRGRGEMSIQLTSVTLAGQAYPIVSDIWSQHGGDKTIETVNKTAGFGAVGAIIGAIAGGGVGAAVGGGIGAAAGLGSSAASGKGQVVIPPEGMVTFHLAQPAEVRTVSEQEMQRLAYGTAPGVDARPLRPRYYPRPYPMYPGYPVYPGYPGYQPYPPAY